MFVYFFIVIMFMFVCLFSEELFSYLIPNK